MAASGKFEKLLEPFKIGSVKTRNRIIKTGAGMLMWHQDELRVNGRVKAFYEAIARGGVGLIIVESPTIDYPRGVRWRQRYRIDHDRYIKGLRELTEIIHRYGCPTFMQMNHDGPWQSRLGFEPDPPYTGQPVAASAVSFRSDNDFHNEVPRALTVTEIEEIVDKFAGAAVRAEKAGFDGVDINASSSHLLHNFLSPFWNRRQDKYGGSREKRARLVTSIIREIKKRLGTDFPVAVCINGLEVGRIIGVADEKCLTPGEARGIARLLEEAGANAVQVRNHWMGYHVGGYLPDVLFYPEPPVPVASFPEEYDASRRGAGANLPLAAGMKQVLSIPVIAVGKLDPVLGEKALREGQADFIGMTRRLIADPELPRKVAAGRLADIAPCTACENCLGTGRCRINADLGTEHNTIEKAARVKRVVVVGGGPAGLEAARVAALRGHDVTLYEKSNRLGGLLPLAALVKGTDLEPLPEMVRYFKRQITGLGVKIRLGREFNLKELEKTKPDAVILATGGTPAVPEIPGIGGRHVINTPALHRRLKSFLRFLGPELLGRLTGLWMPVGKSVVVIGGDIHGCELGEFLSRRGRSVTIVEEDETPGKGMVDVLMAYLFTWFRKKGVTLMPGVRYEEITVNGLTVINEEGNRQTIAADSIIPALPLEANPYLLRIMEGKAPEVYAIGDCREPGLIRDAVADGSRVARAI
ncbi:MAG TPA: FAD-dependent oxidoreductase [Dehalococcoidales bacterium]|nr:FAD-dependent oxidoreductase [Dehalococcoidales bacterium]